MKTVIDKWHAEARPAARICDLPTEPAGGHIADQHSDGESDVQRFLKHNFLNLCHSSEPLELNILSFHRFDSNENFRNRFSSGMISSKTNAPQKLTPRFTLCSTFTVTGICCCQFCHVPSTRKVYFPAGSEDKIASWSGPPSDQLSPS